MGVDQASTGAGSAEPHGWLCTETLKTRFGDFAFENGYPAGDTAERLFELQKLNRAVEVYTTQIMRVGEIAVREGLRAFGARRPNQVVVWENLMDASTLLLTANTETVYAIVHLDLKADGPTVVEVPPHMLGAIQDGLQRYITDIGPLGPDKGQGGRFMVLPPGFQGEAPAGYFAARSPTYSVTVFVRGFQKEGRTDAAVALMKQIKVYPLGKADAAPAMEFLNGSGQAIDTLFPDNAGFFELLAMLVDEEPADNFGPLERFQMQAIGIEKGKPFKPDAKTRALLDEAARLGGAIARANTYASPAPGVFYYPDRQWQSVPEGQSYTFTVDGISQIDARDNVYYMAAGNSPAMMAKNVGQGSQYLWTYRDAEGAFLDGSRTYRLRMCSRACRSTTSGRWWSTTPSAARNCRTASRCPRSAACRARRRIRTAPSTSPSDPTSRLEAPIGSARFPAAAGSRSSGSTAPRRRSSTRPGSSRTSPPCTELPEARFAGLIADQALGFIDSRRELLLRSPPATTTPFGGNQ